MASTYSSPRRSRSIGIAPDALRVPLAMEASSRSNSWKGSKRVAIVHTSIHTMAPALGARTRGYGAGAPLGPHTKKLALSPRECYRLVFALSEHRPVERLRARARHEAQPAGGIGAHRP